jgi:general L-amino acid transport system permease protein
MKDMRRHANRLLQVGLVLALLALLAMLVHNMLANMQARGIQSGLDFLVEPVGFDISESWLTHTAEDPFWHVFVVGLVNTLRVAVPGVVLATVLGLMLAIARISPHPLASACARVCIEALRNIPLLIQLLMLYIALIELMPDPDQAWSLWGGLSFSKAGLQWGEDTTGLSPEYLALCLGLSIYTSAFVAEVFRSGIEAVPKAQTWAAQSLGLTPAQTMREVVLPQAMRVSVPPLTSQYLNLIKNSSLAVAIGYPDLVSIANTTLNQTGRAAECIGLIMLIYLGLSLLTAWLMNRYNRHITRHDH